MTAGGGGTTRAERPGSDSELELGQQSQLATGPTGETDVAITWDAVKAKREKEN